MNDKPKVVNVAHICKECGKDAIVYDGRCVWNAATQSYDIVGFLDDAECSECGATGRNIVDEKEIKE